MNLLLACRDARIRLAAFLSLFLIWSVPIYAQGWTAQITRDAVYDAGRVSLPGYTMGISCAARSAQRGPVLGSQWWEVSVAPPWQYLIDFSDQLVPIAPHEIYVQMTLFVDQTGYQLPQVVRNELEGGWQVMLPMTDQMFAAVKTASRLVLQVGANTVWELPVEGLATGLDKARETCAATWAATGYAVPPGLGVRAAPASAFALPAAVQAHANQSCSGIASYKPDALQAGDLDGDGAPDIVLDWGLVLCNGQSMRGFCGAANCTYDIFLSSKGYAVADSWLATSVQIVPHASGRLGLQSRSTGCAQPGVNCGRTALWNGNGFDRVP